MKKITTLLLSAFCNYAAFAQGYYFEMKITSSQANAGSSMKVYAQDGNSRSEMKMNTPMGPMDMITLALKSTPSTVYMISDKDKTYSEIDISKNDQWKDNAQDEYDITVLGKETVNGYNSKHVKVKRKESKTEEEMWVSTGVADYSAFMKTKTKFTGRENLYKALEAKGAAGFPVKIKIAERGNEVTIDFVKAEKRDNPASLFSLTGYTKSTTGSVNGANMKEMMQKMQNMTPEQQKAFMEQMKQQYQRSH